MARTMTKIRANQLTSFAIAEDGASVSLGFADAEGTAGALELPADCLKALLMTMPEIMRQSLVRRYRDPSLRVVYPLSAWTLEASSERGRLILTLRTPDNFHIAFTLTTTQFAEIGAMAATAAEADERVCRAALN